MGRRQGQYGPLGETMDRIARENAGVWGPYGIARYIANQVPEPSPSGPSFSAYYNAVTPISTRALWLFMLAFECDLEQQKELVWARFVQDIEDL